MGASVLGTIPLSGDGHHLELIIAKIIFYTVCITNLCRSLFGLLRQ